MLKKLGISSKQMEWEELDDHGMSVLMKGVDRSKKISWESVMKITKFGKIKKLSMILGLMLFVNFVFSQTNTKANTNSKVSSHVLIDFEQAIADNVYARAFALGCLHSARPDLTSQDCYIKIETIPYDSKTLHVVCQGFRNNYGVNKESLQIAIINIGLGANEASLIANYIFNNYTPSKKLVEKIQPDTITTIIPIQNTIPIQNAKPIQNNQIDDNKIFTEVQQLPILPEGWSSYLDLANHVVYPEQAKDSGIYGIVYVSYVVEKDGSITQATISSRILNANGIQGINSYLLDDEALRVITSMPKCTPGKQNGRDVRVQCLTPVLFLKK